MSTETYGSYQLVKRIATGGMAQIFLARKVGVEGFEKLLVVKRILPHLAENEEFIRMFLDEARIAARLNHPNIVQIFDLGEQEDTFFIAMEYIHGDDLRRVWKKAESHHQAIPIPLVCRIIMEACAGLDYAHKRLDANGRPLGIVHRDVSPQNILVTFEGGVKIVDFGIAKAADQVAVTRSGVLKGKYAYMSPEQAQGKAIDCRTDIFALGVVLHELLTGARLFKRGSDLQTLSAVNECVVSPPSLANRQIPSDLDEVVMKALARNPAHRYQEAVQLQLALEEWLLRNQQPSSSAHLAAFMRELYADRLAQEAIQGQILVEEHSRGREDEPSPDKDRPPKSRPSPSRPAPSPRVTVSVPPPDPHAEFTLTERSASQPSIVLERPLPQTSNARGRSNIRVPLAPPSSSTAPWKKNGRLWAGLSAVAATVAMAVGIAIWSSSRPLPPAVVRLTTAPPGASVMFNGQSLAQPTPTAIPPTPAGVYPLLFRLEGYENFEGQLAVPATGVVDFPTIALQPKRPAKVESLPGSTVVTLTVRSNPEGARITIDGQPQGPAPVAVRVVPKSPVTIRAELVGFRDEQSVLTIGEGPVQEVTIPMVAVPPAKTLPPERLAPGRATGRVRFVVTPWANVVCDGQFLGQTPFGERALPVGVYECRFENTELGTRSRRVIVRANEKQVVTVKF